MAERRRVGVGHDDAGERFYNLSRHDYASTGLSF